MKLPNFFAELKQRMFTVSTSRTKRKGIKMKTSKIITFGIGAMLAATAALAGEVPVVSNVLGPEGPLYIDGNLYYVGWVSNTLSKWVAKRAQCLITPMAAATTDWRSRSRTPFSSRARRIPVQFWNSI
jgi:hypothetical protein